MFVIKPIAPEHIKDVDSFITDDLIGITSLPKNKHFLHQKLTNSLSSFTKVVDIPGSEQYYFVLENLQTGEVGGICRIEAKTGLERPIYRYRIEKTIAPTTDLPIPRKQQILHIAIQKDHPTRIGALYILPSFRKEGLGRLLSLSRFLFIACFPHRFGKTVIAEMRGYTSEDKQCPFWEGLGRNFLDLKFEDLMNFLEEFSDAIPLFIPHYPIYTSLLPKETQTAIGRVHFNTLPALNLLTKEGFSLTDEVDLFDAGPKISALTTDIRSFKNSREAVVKKLTTEGISSDPYIISNTSLDFRACYGSIELHEDGSITLSSEVARALTINEGDRVRFVHLLVKSAEQTNG